MTLLTFVLMFVINFIVLTFFSSCLMYISYKKQKQLTVTLRCDFRREEQRLEQLTNDLSSVADALSIKLADKEKQIQMLLEKVKYYTDGLERIVPKDGHCENRSAGGPITVTTKEIPVVVTKISDKSQVLLEIDAKFKDIYYYADSGMKVTEIARKTGKTKGEIELILGLRTVNVKTAVI